MLALVFVFVVKSRKKSAKNNGGFSYPPSLPPSLPPPLRTLKTSAKCLETPRNVRMMA